MASWGKFVCIHPGSGSRLKNWPLDNFIGLAASIKKQCGVNIVWILGPAESEMAINGSDFILRDIALPGLVHVFASTDLFIGNDSGIAHLAAATGCPCTIIFGPSDPVVWAPKGSEITIIDSKEKCSPCHSRHSFAKPCGKSCLSNIPLPKVLEACRGKLLQRSG
jgi:ADP-heptose:LPS heptosyltransferase